MKISNHKQSFEGVLRKRCSETAHQTYKNKPMPKCGFKKVAKQSNFTETTLRHGCSPVNLLHIFRTLFPENTSGGLLLIGALFTTSTGNTCHGALFKGRLEA